MDLNTLSKIKTPSKKRVGRGIGSGKGKTAGRGAKGQKKRGKVALSFSGGGLPLYKKIPYLRGLKNKPVSKKPVVLSLDRLNIFKAGSTIDINSLVVQKIISAKNAAKHGVKILGTGDLKIILNVSLPVSESAKKKIEKAGGKIV